MKKFNKFYSTLFVAFFTTTLFAQVPTITSFAPASGPIGTSIVLTGSNFSTTAANNIVYFGAAKAIVTGTTTATSCTVTVPNGATYERISLEVGILTGYSKKPFIVTSSCPAPVTTTSFDSASFNAGAGSNPPYTILGDFDGDGKNDAALNLSGTAQLQFMRNTSSVGSISFVNDGNKATGTAPRGLAMGDLNGDGSLDIVINNTTNTIMGVYKNNSVLGAITFAAPVYFDICTPTNTGDGGVCIGDLDGDGKPEIVGAGGSVDTISVLRNLNSTAGSTFTSASFALPVKLYATSKPQYVYMADIDGDGKPDLVCSNTSSNNVAVFRNTCSIGVISFAPAVYFTTGASPRDFSIGDIDLDGKPDLVVPNNTGASISILQNLSTSGTISFASKVDFATGTNPRDADISDINGDGLPDIITANAGTDEVEIFQNTSTPGVINASTLSGTKKFPLATGSSPRQLSIGDLDGDGHPDLVTVSQATDRVSIGRNLIWGGPIMTSASSKTICSGTAVGLTLTATPSSGTSYTWIAATNTNVNGESTTSQSGNVINNTLTNTTASVQTVIYTVTPTSSTTCSGGTPQPQIVTVTVNPVPQIVNGSHTGCSAATFTVNFSGCGSCIIPSGTTYSWPTPTITGGMTGGASGFNQSTISITLTNTTTAQQTAVYTITPSAGGCTGTAFTYTVFINPLPSMTSTNTTTVCSGVALNMPLTSNVTSTYSWLAANNANTTGESTTAQSGSAINNTIVNSSISTQLVIYTVTPTSTLGSCTGTAQTITVTVNAAPSMTSVNSVTVCNNTALSLPLTSNVAATYSWLATNNANTTGESTSAQTSSTITNTITNTSASSQTLLYTVTPTSTLGSCTGAAQTVSVTVIPTITLTANSVTICSGQSTTLLASGASSYSWNTGATTNTISVNPGTTSFYTVTGTSSGCSTSKTVTVTVNPTPTMTSASTATICSGAAVNIPLTSSTASTYTWIAVNNANTSGESITTQTLSTINNTITHTLSAAQTVIYSVTPTSTLGCPGPTQTVSVTVNPLPTVTNTLTTYSVCSGIALNIPLTSNVSSTFSWLTTDNTNTTGESTSASSGSTINNTIISTTTTATTLIYTVTPTSTVSCIGTTKTFTVTVNPKPTMTSTISKTICSGSAVGLALTSSAASTYTWVATSNINVSGESITTQTATTINNTLTTTNSNTASIVYTVTPTGTAGSCVGTSQVITVSLDYAPTANAGKDSSICTGNVVLYGNSAAPGSGTWAFNSKTDLFTTVSILSPSANNSGASFGGTFNTNDKVTLKWTITSPLGTCPVTIDSTTFTKANCPLSANFTASGNDFCLSPGDSAAVTFTDNSNQGGFAITSYTWTFTGGNPSSFIGKVPPVIKYPYSAGVTTHPVTLQITDASSATSTSPTQNITIRPTPSAAGVISGSVTVCQGQSNVSYSISPVTNASSYAWVFPSGVLYSTNNIETTNFSTVAVTGNIKVVGLNTSCGAGDTSYLTVTVNPLPGAAGVITGTNTVCQGVNGVSYSVGAISSATSYTWTLPTGVTSTGTTTNISADYSTTAQSGLISVYGTNACGVGATATLSVTVNPLPATAGSITGSVTVCQGQTGVSYSITPIANAASYNWSFLGAVASSTLTANSALLNFNSSSSSATIFVSGSNACGTGGGAVLNITVNSVPTVGAISGSVTVCQGQSGVTYSVSSVAGATGYNWTFPSGASSSSPTNIASTDFDVTALSGLITVSAMNTCGTGSVSSLSVTVNPLPDAASLITGAATVCQGQNGASYFVNPILNATTYSWTAPAGSSGSNTLNNYSVNYPTSATSGTVTVYGQNSCGVGASSSLAVTVNPLPAAPVFSGTTSITLCPLPDSMLFYFAPALNATSYSWQLPSGAYVSGSVNDDDSIYVGFSFVGPNDSIKVASVNGCGTSSYSYQLLNLQTLPAPNICMATVDSTSTYNEIYWDKTSYASSSTFHIYRDTANNNFALIGTVPYDSLSMFKDTDRFLYAADGNPNVSSWRYKIAVQDSCGNMSAMSPYHQTMFVQNSVGNFSWNQYQIEGQSIPVSQLSNYLFERDNNSTGAWNTIQTLSASSTAYTDPAYATYQLTADWRSSTQWSISCTPTFRQSNGTQAAIVRSKSNISNNKTTGVKTVENNFSVYPNPATNEITIQLTKDCKNCTIELFNSLGQILMSEKLLAMENKITISDFENGVYYLKINSDAKQQYIRKVIVQH